jgi:drug/metabolite transporter (DMT)-like permease
MFVGELFCFAIYGVKRMCAKEGGPTGREGVNPAVIAIPAMCDICGSSLMFVALTLCAASVYQMMRGVIVVITAFMAIQFLGRKQYAHHWISLVTIVLGVFIVGVVGVMYSKKTASASETSILGVALLLLAQCFTGGQFVSEEKIFDGRSLDPLYVIGFEGFWGVCVFGILLPIFQNIKCNHQLCHNGRLEDSIGAL